MFVFVLLTHFTLLMHGSVSYTPAIRGLWETSCKYTIINQTFCGYTSMYASFLRQMSVIRQTILYSWCTETEVNWVSVININVKIISAWKTCMNQMNHFNTIAFEWKKSKVYQVVILKILLDISFSYSTGYKSIDWFIEMLFACMYIYMEFTGIS